MILINKCLKTHTWNRTPSTDSAADRFRSIIGEHLPNMSSIFGQVKSTDSPQRFTSNSRVAKGQTTSPLLATVTLNFPRPPEFAEGVIHLFSSALKAACHWGLSRDMAARNAFFIFLFSFLPLLHSQDHAWATNFRNKKEKNPELGWNQWFTFQAAAVSIHSAILHGL